MAQLKPPGLKYRLLSVLLFLFWIAHAFWHGVKYRQPAYVWQRLGFNRKSDSPLIWVHASSVGEVALVRPLIEVLSKQHAVLLTTFTASGYQHAERIMPEGILIQILPIDFYPISKAFMHNHTFRLALIAETELWPETLYQFRSSDKPLLQINARLTEKSLQSAPWIRQILQQTLGYFDQHLTRNASDVQQFRAMGVDQVKIKVTGNLKYADTSEHSEHKNLIGRPYVLFASTHKPEEMLFAGLLKSHRLTELAVIAPRHPQRAPEILKSLQPLELKVRQRSLGEGIDEHTQLYLADTLGELKAFMAHATIVVMGGSFTEIGGHNVLEPARLGKAVITGPSDDNIRQDIDLLLQHQAIIQVANETELAQQLSYLLNHPKEIERLASNAGNLMAAQGHVLEDYLQAVELYLKQ